MHMLLPPPHRSIWLPIALVVDFPSLPMTASLQYLHTCLLLASAAGLLTGFSWIGRISGVVCGSCSGNTWWLGISGWGISRGDVTSLWRVREWERVSIFEIAFSKGFWPVSKVRTVGHLSLAQDTGRNIVWIFAINVLCWCWWKPLKIYKIVNGLIKICIYLPIWQWSRWAL